MQVTRSNKIISEKVGSETATDLLVAAYRIGSTDVCCLLIADLIRKKSKKSNSIECAFRT